MWKEDYLSLLRERDEVSIKKCLPFDCLKYYVFQVNMNAAADHPQYGAVMSRLVSSFAEMPESQTWQLSAAFFRDGATPEIEHARRCGTQVE